MLRLKHNCTVSISDDGTRVSCNPSYRACPMCGKETIVCPLGHIGNLQIDCFEEEK